MNIKENIKILLIKSNLTMTQLVEKLNEKYNRNDSVQNLNGKLTRGTLKYREALEIADILGYKIEWIKIK
ncbi:LLM class flavin-dependent oxidoreductase [Clostridium sp. WILCCON 0269]|uniref:LLM class flavin-dependent oxidoreductase n=1 Tax=Candidatus Clostridium eludens TaxID=3381663 RepID=A0ABW8SPY5_9CLOT